MTIPWLILAIVGYVIVAVIAWQLIAFVTMDTHEPYDLAPAGAVFWPLLLLALVIWLVVMLVWTLLRSVWMWIRVLIGRDA